MQLLNYIKDLFTAFQPFLIYFLPFVAFSIFFLPVKFVKMFTGGRSYGRDY